MFEREVDREKRKREDRDVEGSGDSGTMKAVVGPDY